MLSGFWSDFTYRLRSIFRQDDLEHDLDEELRFHLEREAEKYVAQGVARDEALRRARVAFGGLDQIKDGMSWRSVERLAQRLDGWCVSCSRR